MVGRSHCRQTEGEENIFSTTQTSGSQRCTQRCCTHTQTHTEQAWASSAFPPWKNSQDAFPALTLPSSSTATPGPRLFLRGTEFSPRELPKHSHPVHTAKLWSGISAQTSAHQQSTPHHCVRGHVLQKSYILWSERQDETGDSGYLGFWLAGNTTFFPFFLAWTLCWQMTEKTVL